MNTNYEMNYMNEMDLMVEARKEALLRGKINKLELMETARDNELILDMEYIMGLYDNYRIVNSECGFNLYVMVNDDVWSYYIGFVCADDNYESFIVDHIGFPYVEECGGVY